MVVRMINILPNSLCIFTLIMNSDSTNQNYSYTSSDTLPLLHTLLERSHRTTSETNNLLQTTKNESTDLDVTWPRIMIASWPFWKIQNGTLLRMPALPVFPNTRLSTTRAMIIISKKYLVPRKENKPAIDRELHLIAKRSKSFVTVEWLTYMCQTLKVCKNGGSCIADTDGYTCRCKRGWFGQNCTQVVRVKDPCDSQPCQNDGHCKSITSRYQFSCICSSEFEGRFCEIRKNPCQHNDCRNGGSCVLSVSGKVTHTCACLQGFGGLHCELEVDVCASNPCMNEGVCIKQVDMYYCTCKEGFIGIHCEQIVEDPCPADKCSNGGTCIKIGATGFQCKCLQHYVGITCETKIDICSVLNPCMNAGTCESGDNLKVLEALERSEGIPVPVVEDYQCLCLPAFTGRKCESPLDPCEDNPCSDRGVCVSVVSKELSKGLSYKCECKPAYSGQHCELHTMCGTAQNPCQNGATCHQDSAKGFTCGCTEEFTGVLCDVKKTSCVENPCPKTKACEVVSDKGYVCVVRTRGMDVEGVYRDEVVIHRVSENKDNTALIVGLSCGAAALFFILIAGGVFFWKRQEAEMAKKLLEARRDSKRKSIGTRPSVTKKPEEQPLTESPGPSEGGYEGYGGEEEGYEGY